jgi:hypothetical protein
MEYISPRHFRCTCSLILCQKNIRAMENEIRPLPKANRDRMLIERRLVMWRESAAAFEAAILEERGM